MEALLRKLNYKGYSRIIVNNATCEFMDSLVAALPGVQIDTDIDPRFPYEFMILFVKHFCEVEALAPRALHNLVTDGILWFAFPKNTSKNLASDIDSKHGWEVLIDRGFDKVRQVSIDNDWSALRFRNIRYIRSNNGRFDR